MIFTGHCLLNLSKVKGLTSEDANTAHLQLLKLSQNFIALYHLYHVSCNADFLLLNSFIFIIVTNIYDRRSVI